MRMAKMADIRDEHGNPIQLTDEHGSPVVLTDEHGNPMWLTGVATKAGTTLGSLIFGGDGEDGGDGGHGCASDAKAGSGDGDGEQELQPHEEHGDGGSTGSSEEDEKQSERMNKIKKKKGLTQKIKEKLIGVKHKEEHPHAPLPPTTTDRPTEQVEKGAMEKIGVKMPGGFKSWRRAV